jgi:peptidoglycan hydrolase-like protein with peptidoglycan-binding domain
MRQSRGVTAWLPLLLLTACVASQIGEPTAVRTPARIYPPDRPALDRILTSGDIQVAQEHLRDLGFDPGPVNGIFTAQTQAAIRAFQMRYGIPVSGLLDHPTRLELLPGVDPKRTQ